MDKGVFVADLEDGMDDVMLVGVAQHIRDLGRLTFFDLCQQGGSVQVVVDAAKLHLVRYLRSGDLTFINGKTRYRRDGRDELEVVADVLHVGAGNLLVDSGHESPRDRNS